MKTVSPWDAAPRPASRAAIEDMSALFGEWAELVRRPGEDSERLALAIRVLEALQHDMRRAQPPSMQ